MVRAKELSTSSNALTVIAVVLSVATLYFGRMIFIPLALALVLSFLLTPFVSALERIHLGRIPSVFIVITLSLALLGVGTWAVAGQLVQIMGQLPDYKENLEAKVKSLHRANAGNFSKATASVQELSKELSAVPGQVSGQVRAKTQGTTHPTKPLQVQVAPPASNLVQDLGVLLGPLAGPVETTLIVIIFAIFMLVKREDLRNRAIRLAGRGKLSLMTQAFDDAGRRLSRFLLLQFLVNLVYGSLFGLGLYFIGVPHPLLWGVVAAFLRFVPYIGTFVAAALPIAMAIAVFPGWRQAGMAFGVFIVLELALSNFVEPMLYGSHTGISSLAILVAAVFWATVWGPVGLILSTPLTVCLVVLGRHVPQLKFLEVVLGDEPALPPEQHFYQRLLATDEDEAREIAEDHLKENSLESLYQTIFLPALRMAEQDHQIDDVDDEARRTMLRSTRDLIEDLGSQVEDSLLTAREKKHAASDIEAINASKLSVACIPARSGPDELVAMMLAQLLRHAGHQVREFRARDVEDALAAASAGEYGVACISSLPPFAIAQTRTLCKRLLAGDSGLRVVVGFWGYEGGDDKARERLGTGCPGSVTTTLTEAIQQIRGVSESYVAPEMAEHAKT